MLQKESVNRRLESEDGISFTEFSYLLLQARDFLELFDRYGCTLQMGGSDQWGNITAGIELIRKLRAKKVHGLVTPLVTMASGAKFGKTEAGTIWLDPARTSPFRFYQFWLNTDDRDVVSYLKFFTFLERAAIEALEAARTSAPEKREAQRVLAREVTTLVHGADQVARAEHASSGALRRGHRDARRRTMCSRCSRMCRQRSWRRTSSRATGSAMVDLVARVQLAPSKSDARRLVQSGGVYLNNRRIGGSAGARDARAGDWRTAVRAAQGAEADSSRARRLTYRNRYEILSERSVARNSARQVRAQLKQRSSRLTSGEAQEATQDHSTPAVDQYFGGIAI